MPKIAILDDYANCSLDMADWSSIPGGYEPVVFTDNLVDHDALVARLKGFDVVCAMRERTPFPTAVASRLDDLKLFITSGMRNKAVDLETLKSKGVVCCGTDSPGFTTVEHTWALIFSVARHIPHDDRIMKDGGWQTRMPFDLRGKTLGLMGLGRLGGMVATIAAAFGMKVIAWSENLTDARCAEVGAERVSKDALFERADVLSIHMLLSDRSRGLVGARELGLMKPTSILINTSRGPIVEEAALIDALRSGQIRGAGVDVYDHEPLPENSPLRGLDSLVMTPHTGYVSEDTYRLFYGQMVENIKAWHAGKPVREIG